MKNDDSTKTSSTQNDPEKPLSDMRKIDIREIMKGENSIGLEFDGKLYILRITSNSKLILTK